MPAPPARPPPCPPQVVATQGCVSLFLTETLLLEPGGSSSAGADGPPPLPGGFGLLGSAAAAQQLLPGELAGAADSVVYVHRYPDGVVAGRQPPAGVKLSGFDPQQGGWGQEEPWRQQAPEASQMEVVQVQPEALALLPGAASDESSEGGGAAVSIELLVGSGDGSAAAGAALLPPDLRVVASCGGVPLPCRILQGTTAGGGATRLSLELQLRPASELRSRVVQLLLASSSTAAIYCPPLHLLLAPEAVALEVQEVGQRWLQLQEGEHRRHGKVAAGGAGGAAEQAPAFLPRCFAACDLMQDVAGLALLLEAVPAQALGAAGGAGRQAEQEQLGRLAAVGGTVLSELLALGMFETGSWLLGRWAAAGLQLQGGPPGEGGPAAAPSAAELRSALRGQGRQRGSGEPPPQLPGAAGSAASGNGLLQGAAAVRAAVRIRQLAPGSARSSSDASSGFSYAPAESSGASSGAPSALTFSGSEGRGSGSEGGRGSGSGSEGGGSGSGSEGHLSEALPGSGPQQRLLPCFSNAAAEAAYGAYKAAHCAAHVDRMAAALCLLGALATAVACMLNTFSAAPAIHGIPASRLGAMLLHNTAFGSIYPAARQQPRVVREQARVGDGVRGPVGARDAAAGPGAPAPRRERCWPRGTAAGACCNSVCARCAGLPADAAAALRARPVGQRAGRRGAGLVREEPGGELGGGRRLGPGVVRGGSAAARAAGGEDEAGVPGGGRQQAQGAEAGVARYVVPTV
jgi:hypothetical protein